LRGFSRIIQLLNKSWLSTPLPKSLNEHMNSSGLSVKVCLPKEERQELEIYVVIEYLMGLVKLEAQR